jgi:hypothetical protein
MFLGGAPARRGRKSRKSRRASRTRSRTRGSRPVVVRVWSEPVARERIPHLTHQRLYIEDRDVVIEGAAPKRPKWWKSNEVRVVRNGEATDDYVTLDESGNAVFLAYGEAVRGSPIIVRASSFTQAGYPRFYKSGIRDDSGVTYVLSGTGAGGRLASVLEITDSAKVVPKASSGSNNFFTVYVQGELSGVPPSTGGVDVQSILQAKVTEIVYSLTTADGTINVTSILPASKPSGFAATSFWNRTCCFVKVIVETAASGAEFKSKLTSRLNAYPKTFSHIINSKTYTIVINSILIDSP